MPADIRELGEQIPEAFAIIGQNSNLWDFLVNSSLLHVQHDGRGWGFTK
ncbi:hypothetical protein KFU94_65960 [Chloroflexi bacterium TSY]|nr:hypothetical protein [Chloroflexi bacterium TSY]